MSADFFSVTEKHFLVVAVRLLGWPLVAICDSDTAAATTIRHFRRIFRDLSVPVCLRTDGWTQFTSQELSVFLES